VFTVLHLPGHTPGSIALYDEQSGTIFTGDVIYDGQLLAEIVGSDIDDYLHSMRRLREMPVRVVHPGHGPSVNGALVCPTRRSVAGTPRRDSRSRRNYERERDARS